MALVMRVHGKDVDGRDISAFTRVFPTRYAGHDGLEAYGTGTTKS